MARLFLVCALLTGCASTSPCVSATALGERFCLIVCPAGNRDDVACPSDLPYRTQTPRGPVCRAEPGRLPPAICQQIPGGCGEAEPPDYADVEAALAAEGVELRVCEMGLGLRWPGPLEAWPRTRPDITEEQQAAIAAAMQLEGVTRAGIGVCCATETEPELTPCLRLGYNRRDTDPVTLARELATILAPGPDRGAAAHLDPVGREGPRCTPDQALCLPIGYEACHEPHYRADGARRVVDMGTTGGACAHDGECVQQGCGNGCVDWRRGHGPGTCLGYVTSAPTFCGCVQGTCRWFRQ